MLGALYSTFFLSNDKVETAFSKFKLYSIPMEIDPEYISCKTELCIAMMYKYIGHCVPKPCNCVHSKFDTFVTYEISKIHVGIPISETQTLL